MQARPSSWHFLYMARAYMAMRECWVTDRRREAQEEVVADLHTCLEQLTFRCAEMETKIDKCKQRALYHMQLSKKEPTHVGANREKARAKMYMIDRLRLQKEYDKALGSQHMLQQQIDSIVSSHVDMVIVDAMRGFNTTAARMALPQKAAEIERLGESLAERHHEAQTIQQAMAGFSLSAENDDGDDDERLLMRELDDLLLSDSAAPAAPSIENRPSLQAEIVEPIREEETEPLLALPSPPAPKAAKKQLITELASASY